MGEIEQEKKNENPSSWAATNDDTHTKKNENHEKIIIMKIWNLCAKARALSVNGFIYLLLEISHLAALIRILRFCVRQCPVFIAGTRACDGPLVVCVSHSLTQCLCIRDTCKTPTHQIPLINKMYSLCCALCASVRVPCAQQSTIIIMRYQRPTTRAYLQWCAVTTTCLT